MASLLPTRAVRSVACSACRSFTPSAPAKLALPLVRRNYSTPAEEGPADYIDKPRWSYTPPRTKAPFSLHTDSKRPYYPTNNDPEKLDRFYTRFLGPGGEKVLSDEVKWLAVTHKSFDQGRRGFNDRLAFLGKRIVMLQSSLALVQSPVNTQAATPDPFGREPFTHPALEGLPNLSLPTQKYLTNKDHLAKLAQDYQLEEVLRWSPRKPNNLRSSGIALVLAHTMYALVGAISLEKGNKVANQVARERILEPLGFKLA
ncbi:ribonuclease-III-like-domain-containing protein [Aspergillus pseudoustus]|uniref:Ribonuclease-III-like-domain-containing protein n=1 Tax=Aspergillus pseudoustus TaxID=1810923 RepID=A0ABR4J0D1_9EURO